MGIKFMGKDPDENAKAINVNSDGDLIFQQSGNMNKTITVYDFKTTSKHYDGDIITLKGAGGIVINQEWCRGAYTTPKVSMDGLTWHNISTTNNETGQVSQRIFGSGVYIVDVRGWQYFRISYDATIVNLKVVVTLSLSAEAPTPIRLKDYFVKRRTAKPEMSTEETIVGTQAVNELNLEQPGILYNVAGPNLRKSTDWGETYPDALFSHPSGDVLYGVHRNHEGMLFVGGTDGKIWRSDRDELNFEIVLDSIDGHIIDAMGMHSWRNYVVYNEYGPKTAEVNARRVWLSKSYGDKDSWEQIFEGPKQVGYHLHDVCIDPYEGIIWLVSGDGEENSNVYWSKDFGLTWNQMFDYGACPNQFTQIIPLPNCVLFLSDARQVAVYRWDRPRTGIESQHKPMIYLAHVFHTEVQPNEWWSMRATWTTGSDARAYFGFAPYFTSAKIPLSVYGTCDGYEFSPIWTSLKEPGGTISFYGIRGVYGPTTDGYLAIGLRMGDGNSTVKIKEPIWVKD